MLPSKLSCAALVLLTWPAMASDCSDLATLDWLLGDWQQSGQDSTTTESWRRVSDNTFEGHGETVANATGRRSSESLRLVTMQNSIFFLAKVGANPRPVAFTLTHCSSSSATFENPEHDFPRKLAYELTAAGELTVAVSAGADSGFEIHFKRRVASEGDGCDD